MDSLLVVPAFVTILFTAPYLAVTITYIAITLIILISIAQARVDARDQEEE